MGMMVRLDPIRVPAVVFWLMQVGEHRRLGTASSGLRYHIVGTDAGYEK